MVNLQSVLFRLAEPFMDASYTKIDRIELFFHARSSRIDVKNEICIKPTQEETLEWENAHRDPLAPEPNFVTNIFYITIAMSHYGYLKTLQSYSNLSTHLDYLQRHLDMIHGDGSWMGTPSQIIVQTALSRVKGEQAKSLSRHLAYEVQLREPDFVARSLEWSTFLSTWLIKLVDPKKTPELTGPDPTT